jgi:FixJ family two-component response regulator
VITDYAMPGMSGVELAEKLQELRPELATLLATGDAELQWAVAPKLERLLKPFGLGTLAQAVEGCLNRQTGMGAKIVPFAPR